MVPQGCPSIGTKRAKWLLDNFKDIDHIFESLDVIGKTQKAMARHLRENEDLVRKFKRLTTLQDLNQQMDITLDKMEFHDYSGYSVCADIKPIEDALYEFHKQHRIETSRLSTGEMPTCDH